VRRHGHAPTRHFTGRASDKRKAEALFSKHLSPHPPPKHLKFQKSDTRLVGSVSRYASSTEHPKMHPYTPTRPPTVRTHKKRPPGPPPASPHGRATEFIGPGARPTLQRRRSPIHTRTARGLPNLPDAEGALRTASPLVRNGACLPRRKQPKKLSRKRRRNLTPPRLVALPTATLFCRWSPSQTYPWQAPGLRRPGRTA
jgi:hypothetical protein